MTDRMTQLDRIEAKIDAVSALLLELMSSLADDADDAPELDLDGNAVGRERGDGVEL